MQFSCISEHRQWLGKSCAHTLKTNTNGLNIDITACPLLGLSFAVPLFLFSPFLMWLSSVGSAFKVWKFNRKKSPRHFKECLLCSFPFFDSRSIQLACNIPRARFTISLHQRKPSFVVKNYCQDLRKTRSGKLALKGMDTVIFATHLIKYAFAEVSFLICKFMGAESRTAIY